MARRTVKAFTLRQHGELHNLLYPTRRQALRIYGEGCEGPGRAIIPVTVTYDDGKAKRCKK